MNITLINLLKDYIFPDTKSAKGYKVAVYGGVVICALLWLISVISFFAVEMPSRDLEGIKTLIDNQGFGFYVLVSALFWMTLTLSMHDFPKISGVTGIAYVLYASYQDVSDGEVGLYLPLSGLIVFLLLINPVIAGLRAKSV
ncbi:hypothetical protein J8M20_07130 [Pseudoalteromonas luteoviolacea]|uniref:hypothetical protein n=1 Tax=Pseudoalteromonas luteoviolacea TaxID=43657 RepID=UPI001B35D763|nr:hypothetical protein [Pseudoalteromonas luteoviolacea]MBQ4811103.1 hypothetical protein [Pseudoalteromonas luteoviolacea]